MPKKFMRKTVISILFIDNLANIKFLFLSFFSTLIYYCPRLLIRRPLLITKYFFRWQSFWRLLRPKVPRPLIPCVCVCVCVKIFLQCTNFPPLVREMMHLIFRHLFISILGPWELDPFFVCYDKVCNISDATLWMFWDLFFSSHSLLM